MSVVTGQYLPKAFLPKLAETARPGLPSAPSVTLIWQPDRKAHLLAGLAGAISFPFFILASVATGLPFGIAAAFAIAHLAAAAPTVGIRDRDRLSRIMSLLAAFWVSICVLSVSAGFASATFLGEAFAALSVAAFPLVFQRVRQPVDGRSLTEKELSCLDAYSIDDAVIVTDGTGRLLGSTQPARLQVEGLSQLCGKDILEIVEDTDRVRFSAALQACIDDNSPQNCRVRLAGESGHQATGFRLRAISGARIAMTISPHRIDSVDDGRQLPQRSRSVGQLRQRRPGLDASGPQCGAISGAIANDRTDTTEVGDVIDFALRLMRQEADYAGLHVELTETVPDLKVACDRRTLIQIVVNILGNAIKFSNFAGLVTIGYSRADDCAALRFTDQGIGLENGDQARIFGAFDRAGDGSREGHGLGLSIVQGLVKENGGSIELRSVSGKGTTVEILLPLPVDTSAHGGTGYDARRTAA